MKILLIGEICTDVFQYGTVTRICPEAPVPVFNPTRTVKNEGMAGNVRNNLIALGVKRDDITLITNHEQIIKRRYVDEKSNQMLLRVDENDLVERVKGDYVLYNAKTYDAVIVSDYDKGFLSDEDLIYISTYGAPLFIDTKKKLDVRWANNFDFIKINEYEAVAQDLSHVDSKRLIITYGEKGAYYNENIYPVPQVDFKDVSGAGDTFLAALVYWYVSEKYNGKPDIIESICFANKCASQIVQKHGVATI